MILMPLGSTIALCKSCTVGKFSTEEALLTVADCKFCPKGFVQTVPRQPSCAKCVAGQYGDEVGIVSALHTDSTLPKCKAVSFFFSLHSPLCIFCFTFCLSAYSNYQD